MRNRAWTPDLRRAVYDRDRTRMRHVHLPVDTTRRYYFDPLHLYRKMCDAFAPLTLERAYRHPQGYAVALIQVRWQGVTSLQRHTMKPSSCGDEFSFPRSIAYNEASRIAHEAAWIIGHHPAPDHTLFLAQNLFLSSYLYRQYRGWPQEYGCSSHRSMSRSAWSVICNGRTVTIEERFPTGDRVRKYTFAALLKTIEAELSEPQQLTLFMDAAPGFIMETAREIATAYNKSLYGGIAGYNMYATIDGGIHKIIACLYYLATKLAPDDVRSHLEWLADINAAKLRSRGHVT